MHIHGRLELLIVWKARFYLWGLAFLSTLDGERGLKAGFTGFPE